jgi:hypothetical protein
MDRNIRPWSMRLLGSCSEAALGQKFCRGKKTYLSIEEASRKNRRTRRAKPKVAG